MNTELSTADLRVQSDSLNQITVDSWSRVPTDRSRKSWLGSLGSQILGVAFVLSAAPATAVPDYWFLERRRQDVATVAWIVEEIIGRPISRAEALRIARQILECAERERVELAESEARRGIQWNEEP